ncbi:MAG TPA: hypothetical protein DIT64_10565 [Verrucomicrobiales bacterium]|nr:hypothetical protein [Verrucomicrobiales bacterium]HCN77880.1 hypothetical protein [Verrucomicrobiales bacterium]HRJ10158.1 FHA domain-containing protein [Prosthecobacter sp.]HRK16408.1 FHA domain-containing protein [Prosthecobacter sp.]
MPTLVFHLDDGSVLTHELEDGVTTLGRHPDSVVVLEFPSVSAHHAIIEMGEGGCFVSDQKSSNGTRVNGVVIEESRLKEGDRVAFGDVQAVFYQGAPPEMVEAPEPEVIYVPAPEVPAPESPPPMPQRNYRQPKPRRNPKVKVTSYPDTSDSGCATAVIVIALFVTAFIIGLAMRHSKETGGNFITDMLDKISGAVPKITIEKKVDEP